MNLIKGDTITNNNNVNKDNAFVILIILNIQMKQKSPGANKFD
jgi:hypothetical protein